MTRYEMTTLCYLIRGGRWLMLHRTSKKQDLNKNKWIGVGGHFEPGESPEDCVRREVREETGYELTRFDYRGLITFVAGDGTTEYMSLFTAEGFEGEEHPCDEGELAWVPEQEIQELNLWEGDRIFLRLLAQEGPFFSLKLVYDPQEKLSGAFLNGEPYNIG